MLPFSRVAIIGLGLIGSSVARAVRATMPTVRLTGSDADVSPLGRRACFGHGSHKRGPTTSWRGVIDVTCTLPSP